MSDIDLDKFCMTDKGPILWKDVAQRYADEIEWHRSSLNPEWDEIRASERELCAGIVDNYPGTAMTYMILDDLAARIRGTS